ncbi:hypothetical protein M514_12234 [Trichuris suis]|uniref:Uncharacterized protein n=1 Tax=Trichuris suis TaxID=68888 RepID=A0A085LPI0_9BILA|nr:hypothetical protein M513_12234 [Trichuris suis]KFD61140.1 hypothetical protein M514_12234 [Trichuris suis]
MVSRAGGSPPLFYCIAEPGVAQQKIFCADGVWRTNRLNAVLAHLLPIKGCAERTGTTGGSDSSALKERVCGMNRKDRSIQSGSRSPSLSPSLVRALFTFAAWCQ